MKSSEENIFLKKKPESSGVVCLCLANGKFVTNQIFLASRNRDIPNKGKNLIQDRNISKAICKGKITTYLQTLIISTFFFFVFTHKFGEDCLIPRIVTSCKRDSSIRTDSVMICNVFTSCKLLTRESSVVFTSRKVVVSIHKCC